MAERVAAELAEIAELYELADELLQMRLLAAIELVANWQRETRRMFPALFTEPRAEHETAQAYAVRREKAQRFGLIRLMAADHIKSAGNRRRKATFNAKEANEAAAIGMEVDEYQKHKKDLKLTAKMARIIADRAAV
ncbi:hypothetical protein [Sinorhizobium sp. RAC02]|uniref:hypothetical protein n=1 Tax=Sinorhizobium sp. RAC02 TaxID=1842534 RepID=UPI000855AE94|nr:hypothetical protein [Sinorhizobium sp. RAC02]AOF89554.1 hypothetical protein BSY16_2307 [Sinorhizobium sp. RAC02]